MTEHLPASFDAYHRWLGIPPQEQPANHYRLLNLSLFESDPEVIRGGAERQMAYVRNHQLGQYADLTQKILNELGAAKACLLDPGKREAYDAALRQQLEGQARDVEGPLDAAEPDPISAALAAPSESAPADTESRSQTGNRPQNLPRMVGIVAGGALLFVVMLVWGLSWNKSTKPGEPTETPTPEPPRAVASFDAKQARQHQEAWAKYLGVPVEITNSIGMKLVLIPPGDFEMGSPDSDTSAYRNERPQHRVRITKPFRLSVHEVTVGQYRTFVRESGYRHNGGAWETAFPSQLSDQPVVNVNWSDALAFCKWLNTKEAKEYRLPTEAEWEFACRAGTKTRYCFGDDAAVLADYAWFAPNSKQQTHPVGCKKPNSWGLHDMHGNAWEWCEDWYGEAYYSTSPTDDPGGPASGAWRVVRGSFWAFGPYNARSPNRLRDSPLSPGYVNAIGFRLVNTLNFVESSGRRNVDAALHQKAEKPVGVKLDRWRGVTMSSAGDAGLYPPEAAVDGKPTSILTHPGDLSPWWRIDFHDDQHVVRVVLVDTSNASGRLRDITVAVCDGTGRPVWTSELLNPDNRFGGGLHDFSKGPRSLEVAPRVVGSTVIVRRAPSQETKPPHYSEALSLTEVEIWVAPTAK